MTRNIDLGEAEEIYADYLKHSFLLKDKTLNELLPEICKEKHINSAVLMEKTKINKQILSDIRHKQDYTPYMNTIISIGVGLKLDVYVITKLLNAAGHTFSPSRYADYVYRYLVEHCKSDNIPGFDKILEKHDNNRISAYNEILKNMGLYDNELLGNKI